MNDEHFFRTCWLTLKAMKPKTRRIMDEIECRVAGVTVTKKAKVKDDGKDKPIRV